MKHHLRSEKIDPEEFETLTTTDSHYHPTTSSKFTNKSKTTNHNGEPLEWKDIFVSTIQPDH